jgi:hypothetical protein
MASPTSAVIHPDAAENASVVEAEGYDIVRYDSWKSDGFRSAASEEQSGDILTYNSWNGAAFSETRGSPTPGAQDEFEEADGMPDMPLGMSRLTRLVSEGPPQNWAKVECIGQGAFGKVFLGLDQDTGRSFAVKELALKSGAIMPNKAPDRKSSAQSTVQMTFMFGYYSSINGSITSSSSAEVVKQLEEEINVMRCLCHENIVRYIGTQRTSSVLHIFLEFVDRGSIQSLYQKVGLEEGAVRKYTYGLLSGLAYLHSEDIIHGDVKAANGKISIGACASPPSHPPLPLSSFGRQIWCGQVSGFRMRAAGAGGGKKGTEWGWGW